jgi:hypothetical protein
MQAAMEDSMSRSKPNVRDNIAEYEARLPELEADYLGKWVLFYDLKLVDVFDSFDAAARVAVTRFGKGPYLIRRVGVRSVTLPASVMFGPLHALNLVRA